MFLGPVRQLRPFPGSADDVADTVVAEAALSGVGPMGIAMPRSLDTIEHSSADQGSEPGGDGGEREGAGQGQDGGA